MLDNRLLEFRSLPLACARTLAGDVRADGCWAMSPGSNILLARAATRTMPLQSDCSRVAARQISIDARKVCHRRPPFLDGSIRLLQQRPGRRFGRQWQRERRLDE